MNPHGARLATTTAGTAISTEPLPFQWTTAKQWQLDVEPFIASWADKIGSRLRRHRAKVGSWTLEYAGDDDEACSLFAQHWTAAAPHEAPNAYCYHIRQSSEASQTKNLPHCVACHENGRALLRDRTCYTDLNHICNALAVALSARKPKTAKAGGGSARTGENHWVVPATCIEYQAAAGDTRTVAILHGSPIDTSAHGYALTLCKPENALIGDELTAVQLDSGSAHRVKSRLWWPCKLAAPFPQLVPYIALSRLEGITLDEPLATELQNYRNAHDLTRAIDGGSFPEEYRAQLADLFVTTPDAHVLVDPRDLLGADRCLEQSQLTDLILCTHDPASHYILRETAKAELLTLWSDNAQAFAQFNMDVRRAHQTIMARFLDTGKVRPALLNTRLSLPQTQFCLRHFLEGHSDCIRLLGELGERDALGEETSHDDLLLASMRLQKHSATLAADSAIATSWFTHGPRRVDVVCFERRGELVEAVAFDPAADGSSQVRSVWPGQVADFFSRHASLRVRELFTEVARLT